MICICDYKLYVWIIYKPKSYVYIYELYVMYMYIYMYDICMISLIWMLIHVYLMSCSDSTTVVDLSLILSVVGRVLIKVRGNLSVV